MNRRDKLLLLQSFRSRDENPEHRGGSVVERNRKAPLGRYPLSRGRSSCRLQAGGGTSWYKAGMRSVHAPGVFREAEVHCGLDKRERPGSLGEAPWPTGKDLDFRLGGEKIHWKMVKSRGVTF